MCHPQDSILDYAIYACNEVIIFPCQVGYYFDFDVNRALVYRIGIYATITDSTASTDFHNNVTSDILCFNVNHCVLKKTSL